MTSWGSRADLATELTDLPHGYCTECRAQVTVRNGQCLLDHVIDPVTIEETPGRRLRPSARRRRGTHAPRLQVRRELPSISLDPAPLGGGLALLERDVETPYTAAEPEPPPSVRRPDTPRILEPTRFHAPVTDADTLSITGLLVEELWNLSPDEDILGWTPGEMDETLVRTGVRKRKVVAIVALVTVALLVGWRALTWDDARSAESVTAVTEASAALVGALEMLDGPIDDLSNGTITDPLAASTGIARMDETARSLFTLAGDTPLNTDMAPVREQAISQAGGALDLATTLSESFAYASAIQLITRPVELPTETDIDGLAVVTATVTGWVGDFTSGVAALPSNELTDTHRAALVDLAASLPDWQASYLDSLRAKDPARAADHVAEIERQMTFVRDSWAGTSQSIAEWGRERIGSLAVPLVVNR